VQVIESRDRAEAADGDGEGANNMSFSDSGAVKVSCLVCSNKHGLDARTIMRDGFCLAYAGPWDIKYIVLGSLEK
jgi:hypothetical protein